LIASLARLVNDDRCHEPHAARLRALGFAATTITAAGAIHVTIIRSRAVVFQIPSYSMASAPPACGRITNQLPGTSLSPVTTSEAAGTQTYVKSNFATPAAMKFTEQNRGISPSVTSNPHH